MELRGVEPLFVCRCIYAAYEIQDLASIRINVCFDSTEEPGPLTPNIQGIILFLLKKMIIRHWLIRPSLDCEKEIQV